MSSSSKLDPPLIEITELPSSYGRTRLTLMDIEPFALHAYWEVTLRDRRAVRASLGRKSALAVWVLRIYDVTYCHFDGTNAQCHFDVSVDLEAGNWYVKLWSSEKTYCAELGLRNAKGRFQPACRSNSIHLPRAEPSPSYRPAWLKVAGTTKPANRVPHIDEKDIRQRYGKLTEGMTPANDHRTMHRSPRRKTVPAGPLPILVTLWQRTAPSSSSVGGAKITRIRSSDSPFRDH